MSKIIDITKYVKNQNRKEKSSKKKTIAKVIEIIGLVGLFCGITGITITGVIGKLFPKQDWQTVAEEYNNSALELYNLGKYEEAIELYDKAIELEKYNIDDIEVCYYNRGRAYYKLGNYQKAIGDYTIAIGITPRSKYYSDRAMAYKAIGDEGNATLDNMRAITNMLE